MTDTATPPSSASSLDQAIQLALQQAVAHHQAGHLQEAEHLYRAILQIQQHHPDVNHNLGTLLVQAQQPAVALAHFEAALASNPEAERYWLSYIDTLILCGQTDVARQVLAIGKQHGLQGDVADELAARLAGEKPENAAVQTEAAKRIKPVKPAKQARKSTAYRGAEPSDHEVNALVSLFNRGCYTEAEASARALTARLPRHGFGWKALGAALKQQGRVAEASMSLQKAAELLPGDAEAHNSLGAALADQGKFPEAEAGYRRAIKLNPGYAEAHYNLGGALQAQGRQAEAEAGFRQALQVRPDYAEAHYSLGNLLKSQSRLAEAETSFREVLKLRPDYAEAHNNLGAILNDQGRFSAAEASYRRALEIRPDFAGAHNNLGNTLEEQGRFSEAEASYRRALEIKPDLVEAHSNLGAAFEAQGRFPEAEASYRRALEIKPDYAEAYSNLGNILKALDRLAEAEASYRRALELKPDCAEVLYNLGITLKEQDLLPEAEASYRRALELKPDYAEAHNNLGNALREQKRLAEAEASFRRALELKPDYADAYSNLGITLQDQNRYSEAEASFRRALELEPDLAEAYSNLGIALKDLGQLDDAVACYRRALEVKPDYAEVYSNLGDTLQAFGQSDSAVESYQRALELQPDNAKTHYNLGFAYLSLGKLGDGWDKYEGRWQVTGVKRPFPYPWWEGGDLTGKTILVWGEQGVGDEIIFAGMLPDVIQAAGHCVVECDLRLVALFARSFPQAEIVPRSKPPHPRLSQPDIQLQCPMGSLPRWLRSSLESFPQHHGYLKADLERVAFWKRRLDALGSAPKVGVTWRSKLRNIPRDIHYTELSQWGPILTAPGSVFVNLQYDNCRAELEAAREQFGVEIHAWDDIDLMNDLDEAAALTCALDLVISANTSVFSMAGALGKPVWLLNLKNDWAALGTGAMPWFPDTRLFVKGNAQNNWDAVIEDIAEALKQR